MKKIITTTSLPIDLPQSALESLAARFRGNGLCLVILRPDGTLAYFDREASTFLQRYAIPLLSYHECGTEFFGQAIPIVARDGRVNVCEPVPGVLMGAFGYTVKKEVQAIVTLMGRSENFAINSSTISLCQQLGLDMDWLSQEAVKVSSVTTASIEEDTKQLEVMLRDQLRVSGLEQEVESLSSQLTNVYEELSLIYTVSAGMKVNRSPGEFFKQACLDLMGVMDVRGIGVNLRAQNLPNRDPVIYGSTSLPPGAVHKLADLLEVRFNAGKTIILLNDVSRDPDLAWLVPFSTQLLAVPLQREDQILGALFCFEKKEGDFDSVDSKLLTSIANESTIYLENAILFEDARGLMMGLMRSLVSAVDAKDAYTCGHSERVALCARELAIKANLSSEIVERVYMAGLLHDVGKIGVPEAVLQKPGKLTPEEFDQMKLHPEIGARILGDVKQLEDIIPGVLYHHEKWDGTGYPSKKKGEEIPIFGRLICLADCFDAMTSNRTYRRALPFETAMSEIAKGAGTQFDPVLAKAFIDIGEKRLRELSSGHHEQTEDVLLRIKSNLRAA